MDLHHLGRILMIAGAVVFCAGLYFCFGGKMTTVGLGRLPGDIRIEKDSCHFYFPITTSILISMILTVILYLLSRLR